MLTISIFGLALSYAFHSKIKNIVFCVKYLLSYIWEWINRKKSKRTIPLDCKSIDPAKIGLTCLPEAAFIELSRPLRPSLKAIDGADFSGVSRKGTALRLRLLRISEEKVDVWLYLRTADGISYQLPHQPHSTTLGTVNANVFSAAGLLIEVLDPLRCWRIVYNGFLRKHSASTTQVEDDAVVAQFHFTWRPIYSHMAFPDDISLAFKAQYLAAQDWLKGLPKTYKCNDEKLEQFGQLKGEIGFGGNQPNPVIMRGLKSRRHGESDWESVMGRVSIQGVMEEGTVFHLFGDVSKDLKKDYVYGYIIPPCNMKINHLKKCDLNCSQLIAYNSGLPGRLDIVIISDDRNYCLQLKKCSEGIKVYEGNRCDISVNVWEIKILLNGSIKGHGFIEISKPNTDCNKGTIIRSWELRSNPTDWEPDTKNIDGLVVELGDLECRSSKLVGGKGSSLAKLMSLRHEVTNKFIVPSGLCVTKNAFEKSLETNYELKLGINRLQDVAWKRISGDLETECQKIVESMNGLSVSTELRKELHRRLTKLLGDSWEDLRFAVRSSGIGIEDSGETSAAGQNETYLGVKGLDNICLSIVKCWASQFAYRSIEYKRQNGQLLNEGIGVVVQQMVSAEVAGVLFTRDPVDGSILRMAITCNYGLGESVVSGVCDPDTIILTRSYDGSISIHQKLLGLKSMAIKMNEIGGTEEQSLDIEASRQFSLSDEYALKLGKLAVTIEDCFGGPRDIEWAMSKGDIYLLQVRPITTVFVPTDYEILHEFDTSLRTDDEHFSTANVGEVMPGCTHPITHGTVLRIFEIVMQRDITWKEVTHRYDPIIPELLHIQFGRVLLDRLQQKSWQLEEKKGSATEAMEIALYGRILEDDDIKLKAIYRYEVPPFISRFNFLLSSLKGILFGKREIIKYHKVAWALTSPISGADTVKEAHDRILQQNVGTLKMATVHVNVTFASSILNVLLFKLLGKDNYEDFATLIGSSNIDVESGNVPISLQELANAIANNCAEFSTLTPEEALKWVQKDDLCGQLYRAFLKRHGHRCRYEFDLGRLPWNANEINLISVLQNLVKSNFGSNDTKVYTKKPLNDDPFKDLHVTYSPFWKMVANYVYNMCRNGIRNREMSKSVLIKYVDAIRSNYRDLGKMMVKDGFIPEERLVFFLTDWEISQLLKSRSSLIIKRAMHRRRLHQFMEDLEFPEMVDNYFIPVEHNDDQLKFSSEDTVIKGCPVCRGIVTAYARVITSFNQCNDIQQGDILITHATDIAWSPYFPLLSGVVTEIGGLISHGAVVAREFGLPCVVGAFGATKAFQTGDKVLLDASSGLIRKIE